MKWSQKTFVSSTKNKASIIPKGNVFLHVLLYLEDAVTKPSPKSTNSVITLLNFSHTNL